MKTHGAFLRNFSKDCEGEIQKKWREELALQPILCLNQYINPKFIFFLDHIHVIIDENRQFNDYYR